MVRQPCQNKLNGEQLWPFENLGQKYFKSFQILQVLCAFIRCHLEGQTLFKLGYIDMDAPLGLSSGIE